jgi:hypothetical protein
MPQVVSDAVVDAVRDSPDGTGGRRKSMPSRNMACSRPKLSGIEHRLLKRENVLFDRREPTCDVSELATAGDRLMRPSARRIARPANSICGVCLPVLRGSSVAKT